jgi:ethanolamine ammonia-lyase large subunit
MEDKRARLSLNLITGESITYELDSISRVIIEDGKFYAYNEQEKELVNVGLRRIQSATAELFVSEEKHAETDSREDTIIIEMINSAIKKVDEALDMIYRLRKDLVDIRVRLSKKE